MLKDSTVELAKATESMNSKMNVIKYMSRELEIVPTTLVYAGSLSMQILPSNMFYDHGRR